MDTKQYITMLKKKSKEPISVAMRGAIVFFLHSQHISFSIIAECMKCSRQNCYHQFYQVRDLLESGDTIMRQAYAEISCHKVEVKPFTIGGSIFTQHAGYKLLIDNEIY